MLCSYHKHLQKEAIFKHYDQNTKVLLCLILFLATDLVPGTKVCEPVLTPLIKLKENMPNFCNLKAYICINDNKDSKDK